MQKQLFSLLIAAFVLLAGCGDASSTESSTGPDLAPESEQITANDAKKTPPPAADTDPDPTPRKAEDITKAMVEPFVPEGDVLMDWEAGDLNRDAFPDVVLITKDKNEAEESDVIDNPLPRPVILLLGNAQNELTKAEQSNDVALCGGCGGVFGDPHSGIVIKDGYFSIEHYGGSNWRWTRIMTFKYVEAEKTWYLHKDGGESYNTGEPDKVETDVKTEKDFGKVKFADFSAEGI